MREYKLVQNRSLDSCCHLQSNHQGKQQGMLEVRAKSYCLVEKVLNCKSNSSKKCTKKTAFFQEVTNSIRKLLFKRFGTSITMTQWTIIYFQLIENRTKLLIHYIYVSSVNLDKVVITLHGISRKHKTLFFYFNKLSFN